jgi:hypothetical protein
MIAKRFVVRVLAAVVLTTLAACGSDIQTTSGRAYLEAYETPSGTVARSGGSESIDEKVRRVAAVEPILRFPSRIGLARIENGELSGIPSTEVAAWMSGAERLGPTFGDFVPLSRLVAEMVTDPSAESTEHWWKPDWRLRRTMEKIRLGAARQHLDAVLVYEVYGHADQSGNLLAALNVTIIGAFLLPGESIDAQGFASALLLDVRNGYPYGTARHVVERDAITPSAGSRAKARQEMLTAMSEAAVGLVPEVETMLRRLHVSLAQLDAPKRVSE